MTTLILIAALSGPEPVDTGIVRTPVTVVLSGDRRSRILQSEWQREAWDWHLAGLRYDTEKSFDVRFVHYLDCPARVGQYPCVFIGYGAGVYLPPDSFAASGCAIQSLANLLAEWRTSRDALRQDAGRTYGLSDEFIERMREREAQIQGFSYE